MAPRAGLEPATRCLEGSRSIRLRYLRLVDRLGLILEEVSEIISVPREASQRPHCDRDRAKPGWGWGRIHHIIELKAPALLVGLDLSPDGVITRCHNSSRRARRNGA
jgi:hypothetical protein